MIIKKQDENPCILIGHCKKIMLKYYPDKYLFVPYASGGGVMEDRGPYLPPKVFYKI